LEVLEGDGEWKEMLLTVTVDKKRGLWACPCLDDS
jgi:hypothetical protein